MDIAAVTGVGPVRADRMIGYADNGESGLA
jgi:hypothetical protein